MVRIDQLFEVVYGVNLELLNCTPSNATDGLRFVSRTSRNNGVAAFVEEIEEIEPNPAHTISVAGGGSVLSSFYQDKPYYSGRDLFYLKPKVEMSITQMLYYCMIIEQNKYKYGYGRQANKTIKQILIPAIEDIPQEILEFKILKPVNIPLIDERLNLDTSTWKYFKMGGDNGIFTIKNGFYNKKPEHLEKGNIPFIGATEYNNGITEQYSLYDIDSYNKDSRSLYQEINTKLYISNAITVSNNGSVGCAFYQEQEFSCTHDVNVLYLKNHTLNKYIALFLCTVIEQEKFRWAYGRKWRPMRMPNSIIKLPVTNDGQPDFEFMEKFIKTLKYSNAI